MPQTPLKEASDTHTGASEYHIAMCNQRSEILEHGRQMTPFLMRLEKNLDGVWTAEEVANRFLSGQWQVWLVMNGEDLVAVAATEVWRDDSDRGICSLRFVVGHDYKSWMHLIKDVEEWASEIGCYKMRNENAPGHMRRALKDYKVTHYVTEKVLG